VAAQLGIERGGHESLVDQDALHDLGRDAACGRLPGRLLRRRSRGFVSQD
jgi:hypothetical protein